MCFGLCITFAFDFEFDFLMQIISYSYGNLVVCLDYDVSNQLRVVTIRNPHGFIRSFNEQKIHVESWIESNLGWFFFWFFFFFLFSLKIFFLLFCSDRCFCRTCGEVCGYSL